MKIFQLIYLLSLIAGINAINKCNYYQNSPSKCVTQTTNIKCQYDLNLKMCLEVKQQNLGCSPYLNKQACISQMVNLKNDIVFCAFIERCQTINYIEVQSLGCFERLSKYACMNVQKEKCIWNKQCTILVEDIRNNLQQCDLFNDPVTPYTCQTIKSGLCMSNGFEGDYKCIELRQNQLSELSCNVLGLNEQACLAITTIDQFCIFIDNQCKQLSSNLVSSCNQKLNKNACLSQIIYNGSQLACEWVDNSCRMFQDLNYKCQTKNEVNISVCRKSQEYCSYDEKLRKCTLIEINDNRLSCDSPGLSKRACLKIKSQNCSFFEGSCKELNENDLQQYQCDMELNESACVNLKNSFQYCLWNGNNCKRLFINQDVDCPLTLKNKYMKVNGNVCQAISKSNIGCKYNEKDKICIKSSINDSCNTSYLNQYGCQSILKDKETCQWTEDGCKSILIEQRKITCENLKYANPIACSLVYENNSIGCYYDKLKQQCKSVFVDSDDRQIIKFLNTITCKYLDQGINKVLCASINTEQTPCRWYQDKCIYISKQSDISSVSCLHLEYSNFQACALATKSDEPCRYFENEKGCINNIALNTNCYTKGLNQIGCNQINAECYFDKIKCTKAKINAEDDTTNNQTDQSLQQNRVYYSTSQKCNTTSVTKKVCSFIITKGELCIWSQVSNSCAYVSVEQNQKCEQYIEDGIIVNPNVCASINNNQDYCAFDEQKNRCKIYSEKCKTKCCTDNKSIGINANSCCKYSSKEVGVYCFFKIQDAKNQHLIFLTFQIQTSCSSMNANSCYMIEWSTSELCYYNGEICMNVNFEQYKDFTIFTQKPKILNKFACLSIEAKLTIFNKLKFFNYDDINLTCNALTFNSNFPFNLCEDAIGNKNLCTRLTGNNFCKWDQENLKCVTLSEEELGEIQTCDSNLNIKTCVNSKFSNCLFLYNEDKCVDAPQNVDCDYFSTKGQISNSVCKYISKTGQLCEYFEANKTCVQSETNFEDGNCNCDISRTQANNRVCYKRTCGNCRWNSSTLTCYINEIDIEQLSCSDNLNKILCTQVSKEACKWDDVLYQCQLFLQTTSQLFESSNQNLNHLYNEKACLLISGAGYYYNKVDKKCILLDETKNTLSCNQYQMNKYACLYLTRSHNCYYDINEQPPNNLCKQFEDEQSLCSTENQINIEVCMNLPLSCYFDESTLKCLSFQVEQTMTCTQLFNYSKNKKHHNKIACASISSTLTENYGEKLCPREKITDQKCRFEKYCYWSAYTCKVYKLLDDYKNKYSQSTCPDFVEVDNCPIEAFSEVSNNYTKDTPKINILEYSKDGQKGCTIRDQQIIMEYAYTSKLPPIQQCQLKICYISSNENCSNLISDEISTNYESQNQNNTLLENFQNSSNSNEENFCDAKNEIPYDEKILPNCNPYEKLIHTSYCLLIENIAREYNKSYSKALCLELNKQNWFFDINQGGCIQLKSNEHKIPNCESIYNKCYRSYSKTAICQNGQMIDQPGNTCSLIKRPQQICQQLNISSSALQCLNIKSEDTQPILCSKAQDYCRFDGVKCVKTYQIPCGCDKSFSKSLCEFCGCDFMFLGYCQEKKLPPQLNQDCSNKYYLCYEVTQFVTNNTQKVCGLVDQACKFTTKCEDATHSICKELIGFVVSQQACIRCSGLGMKYETITQQCYPTSQIINQCENLNKIACLQFSRNIQCSWQKFQSTKCNLQKFEFTCREIQINQQMQLDCSTLNYDACNQEQINLCWFNEATKLCEKYNPYQGECDSFKNKQNCNLSMIKSCKWVDSKCQIALSPSDCTNLNKFGCLNVMNIPCVWSDKTQLCQKANFSNQHTNCTQFLNNQNEVSHMNAQTCTQINVTQNCILGSNYKCREIFESTFFDCETRGLNRKACLLKTKGQCAFSNNKCIPFESLSVGCQPYLNEVACLNQNDVGKFNTQECSNLNFNNVNDIIDRKFAPYSEKACQAFENEIGLVYSKIQKRCLNIDKLKRKWTSCSQLGINKYVCLNKIESFCEYNENRCSEINHSNVKTCLNTLNQFACTQLGTILCKFQNNQCQNFSETDEFSCALSQFSKSKVNPNICAGDRKNPCFFDDTTKQCELVSESYTSKQCFGYNKQACIFNSKDTICEFNQNEKLCKSSLGDSYCTDLVNKNKCLAIITKGQYCQFDEKYGCQILDKSVDILKCQNQGQTNPYTCSQSLDVPCFFDKKLKMCVEYTNLIDLQNINDFTILKNYQLSNINSFNKKTCEQFNQEIVLKDSMPTTRDVLLFWKEACIEVISTQLFYLKCNQNLNKLACLSIQTPFQYCQYKDKKCISVNLKDFQNTPCESIQQINSGVLCSQTQDVACQFNSQRFRCERVFDDSSNLQNIQCVEKNPEQKGYNKLACSLIQNQDCIFKDYCYKVNKSVFQFCQDASDIVQCSKVEIEGCSFQENKCLRIEPSDQNTFNCEQAINKIGCMNILKEGQYCQYLNDKCVSRALQDIQQMDCEKVININHYSFCEQPKDQACIYDFKTKSCQVVSNLEDLICQRGINKIACSTLTDKKLNCQYIDYCYDPNYGIYNCNNQNKSLCCREAGSIENCLNQFLYQCSWQNDECVNYEINKNANCDDIQNSSYLVCISFEDSFCVYDSFNHICQSINPTSCDQLQSSRQCSKITTIPCIWNDEEQKCVYLEKQDASDGLISALSSAQMNCKDITFHSGNQRACMNIEKQGQMCIYKDNQCQTFTPNLDSQNCLENININSCLHQTISDCFWDQKLFKVKKSIEKKEIDVFYGNCIKFERYDQTGCDSKLSYTSCLKITKEGVFCIWQNQKCQTIDDDQRITYEPSNLRRINKNACGLINNGDFVKYDKNTNLCIKVEDIQSLSCLDEGLNKDACLNIKIENCYWDQTRKKCRIQKVQIDVKLSSCKIQNWSSLQCSQINLNEPCGFFKNGCDYVDIHEARCTQDGLNKYGCLNIKSYPCIWIQNINDLNYHCEDYITYIPCNQIPANVNSKVCSIIKEGACYYDQITTKCEIPNKNEKNCELIGLNIIGCVQIENCFFDQKCQFLNKVNYKCKEFPIANKYVCKNAIDSCQYNEIQYGCSKAYDELCSNDSLSVAACNDYEHCIFQQQTCQCKQVLETYNCNYIKDSDKCLQQSHCIIQQEDFQRDISFLKNTKCRFKTCSDLIYHGCDIDILSSICFFNQSNQCQQASKCGDIIQPLSKCNYYKINGRPCQMSDNQGFCQELQCDSLSNENCKEYSQFCKIEETCKSKQCVDYTSQQDCIQDNCDWNYLEKICKNQVDCSKIQDETICNNQIFKNKSCYWVNNDNNQMCTEYGCHHLDITQQCQGFHLKQVTFVELSDSTCVSCEEIVDSCQCIQQSKYCNYDFLQNKCSSKNCQSYSSQEECPSNFCQYISKKCEPQCQYIYDEDQCDQRENCKWEQEKQNCHTKCENFKDNSFECQQDNGCFWNDQEQCQVLQQKSSIPP